MRGAPLLVRPLVLAAAVTSAACGADAVADAVVGGPGPEGGVFPEAGAPADTGRGGDGDDAGGNTNDATTDAPVDSSLPLEAEAGACTEYEVEPNDSPSQANTIDKGTMCGILDAPGDLDSFVFTFAAAGVPFNFGFLADGDGTVFLIGPDATQHVQGGSGSTLGGSSVQGTYQVQVYSPMGQVQSYAMTLSY